MTEESVVAKTEDNLNFEAQTSITAGPVEPYGNSDLGNRYPELSPEPMDKRPIIYGVIFAVVFVLIFLAIGVWLFFNPVATAILRDIFIIYLGLGAFVIILLLIALVVITAYLVIKVNDLVQLLDREIKPVLLKLQDTAGTVQGTTTFIRDHAVRPIISTVSTYAAARAVFRALFQRK
jgi:hypothetical protein